MKLNELFQTGNLTEAPNFLSKIKNAIDPTSDGRTQLKNKTTLLTQKWSNYRGQTNAIPNAANIEHWIKGSLGLDDPDIWAQAVEEFSEENPAAGQKYKDEEKLSPGEISQFFNKLIQIRTMNPNVPLWTQKQQKTQSTPAQQNTTQNNKSATTTNTPQDEKNAGLPSHPVFSKVQQSAQQSAQQAQAAQSTSQPEQNPATPLSSEERTKAGQVDNPGVNPEPVDLNKPAMLPPDAKDAVDWASIRKRFPEKPRVKVKMATGQEPESNQANAASQ